MRARVTAPEERYRLLASTDRFERVLAAADLCVCRAGGSVFELAACAAPAILVPYPYATADHQRLNAEHFARAGAGRSWSRTPSSTPARLRAEVAGPAGRSPHGSPRWRGRCARAARPDAAADVADELLALAGHEAAA